MNNYIFLCLCLFTQNLFSQESAESDVIEKEYYTVSETDVEPEFPGGGEKMYSFIAQKFKMPLNNKMKDGKLIIDFIVGTDGSISNIELIQDMEPSIGREGIRVVRMFPKWKPGEKNGEKVKVQYRLPITINYAR